MNRSHLILAFIILVYLVNGIIAIPTLSITADEGSHLSYGIRMLKGNPERINPEKDNSKMPISVINALPRAVEQLINPSLHKSDNGERDIINGRYITLFFSVLTILLVFTWSRQLYGIHAGLFSAFLFACCPNNFSNAILVSTDSYAVFFLLASCYTAWRYANNGSRKDFIILSILIALSQLAKQSLFHLFLLIPICLLVHALATGKAISMKRMFINGIILLLSSWLIINAGFLFYGMNKPLESFHFMSNLFKGVQAVFPAKFPVPLSSAFITGLDQAKYYDQLGGGFVQSSFGNVTILGHSATGGGFWYYYWVSLFFKTPITYLLLFAVSIGLLIKQRSRKGFFSNEWFLFIPIIYFLVLMSFLYKTQCGIRHIIFVYPLLFIVSGTIIPAIQTGVQKFILGLLSIYLLISVALYFPNVYAYTNEFIRVKKTACYYVGASNINIGQSGYMLNRYMNNHPEISMAPELPRSGKYVISVDAYEDIWNTGKYRWLRKLEPTGELFHSFLLFDVQDKDLKP